MRELGSKCLLRRVRRGLMPLSIASAKTKTETI